MVNLNHFILRTISIVVILTFFRVTVSCNDPIIQSIEPVAFITTDSIPLKGVLILPQNEVKKIAILLTDVIYDVLYPEFSLINDTTSFDSKMVLKLVKENIGVFVIGRRESVIRGRSKLFMSQTIQTLADDTENALLYLKSRPEFKNTKIGIWGISETGCSAAIVASRNQNVAFLLLQSTPGTNGVVLQDFLSTPGNTGLNVQFYLALYSLMNTIVDNDVFYYDNERYNKEGFNEDGMSNLSACFWNSLCNINHTIIPKYQHLDTVQYQAKRKFLQLWDGNVLADDSLHFPNMKIPGIQLVDTIIQHWYTYRNIEFIKWNPDQCYPQINCPVFFTFGEADTNINVSESIVNVRNIIRKYNKNKFTVKVYPKLNHFLEDENIAVSSGKKDKYESISLGVPEIVYKDILLWFNGLSVNAF
ncbi:MAG: dienelactone hydrolase family protein [Bacteroidales bacterium]|jgi:dienelactone hydrolase|nr:dienelactone hydrolase family protein [Bacteroidales bacterium]